MFSGAEHELLKSGVRKRGELITSEDVIEELVEVIDRKFPNKAFLVKEFLKLSEVRAIRKNSCEKLVEQQKVRDPEDRHVLAAAKAARCVLLVTGDDDLLSLKRDGSTRIVTTKEALRELV